jgi:hypothetical protein
MATEEGLIDIIVDLGFVNRLSPRELRYEGFKDRSEWNYFLLTTNTLNPIYDAGEKESEILTEDFPGHYVDCLDFDYGVYDYDSSDADKILNVIRNITKGQREKTFLDKLKDALNKPIF